MSVIELEFRVSFFRRACNVIYWGFNHYKGEMKYIYVSDTFLETYSVKMKHCRTRGINNEYIGTIFKIYVLECSGGTFPLIRNTTGK